MLLCQFLVWREIGFGCTYYYVLGLPYSCGVVLVFLAFFLLWRESGSGGKLAVFLLWRESFITTGKKRYSRLSGRCAIMSVFLVAIVIFVLVQLEL